ERLRGPRTEHGVGRGDGRRLSEPEDRHGGGFSASAAPLGREPRRARRRCWRTAEDYTCRQVESRMVFRETEHLRVLIANERKDRLALVAPIVVALGHEVIAREIDVAD